MICLLDLFSVQHGYSFSPSLRQQDMEGVWKLTRSQLLLPSWDSSGVSSSPKTDESILLRLREDGTFALSDSHDTDDQGIPSLQCLLGRGGCWKYSEQRLTLAVDRPKEGDPGQVHDMVLSGELQVEMGDKSFLLPQSTQETSVMDENRIQGVGFSLSIANGKVSIGKFMYPKRHKAFFEDPMLFHPSSVGSFSMTQVLANRQARPSSDEPPKSTNTFHKADFYNRRFYLTASPHQVNPSYAAQDKRYDESQVLHDLRVLPVTFFANNTFSAVGVEKILRGRFGIEKQTDRLWFQVSLFGAGRSAPGSVYSEGRLLSHDDRRGYVGEIQAYNHDDRGLLHVQGEFYYGTDLKRANKPNSMGTFTLQEIVNEESQEEDPDEGEDGIDDPAFQ